MQYSKQIIVQPGDLDILSQHGLDINTILAREQTEFARYLLRDFPFQETDLVMPRGDGSRIFENRLFVVRVETLHTLRKDVGEWLVDSRGGTLSPMRADKLVGIINAFTSK